MGTNSALAERKGPVKLERHVVGCGRKLEGRRERAPCYGEIFLDCRDHLEQRPFAGMFS
jgi:hypothetical protein